MDDKVANREEVKIFNSNNSPVCFSCLKEMYEGDRYSMFYSYRSQMYIERRTKDSIPWYKMTSELEFAFFIFHERCLYAKRQKK